MKIKFKTNKKNVLNSIIMEPFAEPRTRNSVMENSVNFSHIPLSCYARQRTLKQYFVLSIAECS